MRNAFLCAIAFLASVFTCNATPVSREYVDEKLDGMAVRYVWSDTMPPTNALNSIGQMFKVTTPNPRGGFWQVSGGSGTSIQTYTAYLKTEADPVFTWASSGNNLQVSYNMQTGKITVKFTADGNTSQGTYVANKFKNPLNNELQNYEYEGGTSFDSLTYTPQGAYVRAQTPYNSFLEKSVYNADMAGVVRKVNGMSGPNITLNIPSIAGLASETYVNNNLISYLYANDPYQRTYTPQSVVGRIYSLEKTAQEYQHNVVYDLWAENFGQVINGKGQVYDTIEQPYGLWERTTLSQPDVVVEQYNTGSTNVVTGAFEWKSVNNNVVTYTPTTGEVKLNGNLVGLVETNLNPMLRQDLGSVTNTTDRNILKFTTKGWIKRFPARTQITFDETLPVKTVTGLNWDDRRNELNQLIYDRGLVVLPNYTGMFKYYDMDSWSGGYTEKSVVGRIRYLESGGANKEYLNRRPITDFTDQPTTTNNSVVANLVRIKNDYTTHQNATNIAKVVSTNVIDKQHIKSRGFYDKGEVDTLIANSVEQKRVLYLYDDQDNPTQVVDSQGRLFRFGIEDFGGSYNVVYSDQGTNALGKYTYIGKANGTNIWVNANNYKIWFVSATGTFGDPSVTYEPDSTYIGLDPEAAQQLPNFNTEYTKATFTKQQKHDAGPYREPYNRFTLDTETKDLKTYTDNTIDSTVNYLTNVVPHLRIGTDEAANRRWSPIFNVTGELTPGANEHTVRQLTDVDTIGLPTKTEFHQTIDLQFQAKIPRPTTDVPWVGAARTYYFIKSSNEQTSPSIGLQYTNAYYTAQWYVVFNWPNEQRILINNINLINSTQLCDVRVMIEKNAGFATLTISNLVNNISQSFKSTVATRPNAPDDSIAICVSHPARTQGAFTIDVDTVTAEYEYSGKNKLVGFYASNYRKADTIYAEQQLGSEVGIMLRPASPDWYGVVKPDGVTIRVENGLLVSDAGGMQEDQVKQMLGQTDMNALYGAPTTTSMIGRIKQLEQQVATLQESMATLTQQYQLLYEAVSNSTQKIEGALGGN